MFKHGIVSVMTLLAMLATTSARKPLGEYISPSGDRIDWRPGDRIVLRCDMPDTLVVYGVADDSYGFPGLARLPALFWPSFVALIFIAAQQRIPQSLTRGGGICPRKKTYSVRALLESSSSV